MKKRFTSFFSAVVVACMAFAQTSGNVVYSWESPEGTVIESGGTATSVMGADDRANYSNAGYYSLCLNGKKANVADSEVSSKNESCRIVIALDEALQEGDSIYITAYRNKNADGKKASIYFLYENGTEVNDDKVYANICADDADADYDDDGAEPTTHGYLVPAEAAGSKTITLSRNSTNTNLFITKFVIVRQGEEEPGVVVESPWVGSAVENGVAYYIYNVKAHVFLTGANDWGTRASLALDGNPFVAEGGDGVFALNGVVANSETDHYLGTGGYIDSPAANLTLTEVGKGVYTIGWDANYYASGEGSSILQTVTELSDACYWQFLTKEDIQSQMVAANALNPYAVTPLIACANFSRNNTEISAWIGEPSRGGDNDNMCAEKWNAGISAVSQTLTGLPNGTYKLQAQGFYRMGGVDDAAALRDAGTEVYDVKFFANTDSVLVMSVMDEAEWCW